MPKEVLAELERKMKATLEDLKHDLASLRTGRAAPSLVDRITIVYYGTQTPLSQVANVTVPDARQLLITPWDKSIVGQIANVISKSDLGVQAVRDGDAVRVSVPTLNEERRKEMVKLAGKKTEEHKVALRNIRRDANDHLKKLEKDGGMTKDDLKREEDSVQKITDKYITEADKIRANKEEEIMEV
jgi:ribosome recycling factor